MRKITTEELETRLKEKLSDDFVLLEKPIRNSKHSKVLVKHCKCKKEFHLKIETALYSNTKNLCPHCSKHYRPTQDEWIKRVLDRCGNEYDLLSNDFKRTVDYATLRCKKCGHVFKIQLGKFINAKRGCPKCGFHRRDISHSLTIDEIEKRVHNLYGDEFTIVGEYKGTNKRISVRHNRCGNVHDIIVNHLLEGHHKCPKCHPSGHKLTHDEYAKQIEKLTSGEYTVLEPYVNIRTKIAHKHLKCGNVFKVSPGHFKYGNRCPKCLHSKGEDRIHYLLSNFGKYSFKEQYKFNDLRSGKDYRTTLRFDFAVFDNDSLICLIEYDGEQHFCEEHQFNLKNASESYQKLKRNDELKNKYCKKNNYKLIRISYLQYKNIEDILYENGLIVRPENNKE